MAKSIIELALELAEIVDKQRVLASREVQIKQELQEYQNQSQLMSRPISETLYLKTDLQSGNGTASAHLAWNPSFKIDKKSANILKRYKYIMTNREICEAIVAIEKNDDPEYLKLLIRKFSAVVGGKAKNGRMFKRIDIDGVFYFALPDWFDITGDLKPEFDQPE